jgi:hypothetical protein
MACYGGTLICMGFAIIIRQFQVTIATRFPALTRCTIVSYVVVHERASSLSLQCLVSIFRLPRVLSYCWQSKTAMCSMGYVYKEGICSLRFICTCCSWEMALNVGLDGSCGNIWDCKIMWEEAEGLRMTGFLDFAHRPES